MPHRLYQLNEGEVSNITIKIDNLLSEAMLPWFPEFFKRARPVREIRTRELYFSFTIPIGPLFEEPIH